jgi:hypothetical protein
MKNRKRAGRAKLRCWEVCWIVGPNVSKPDYKGVGFIDRMTVACLLTSNFPLEMPVVVSGGSNLTL